MRQVVQDRYRRLRYAVHMLASGARAAILFASMLGVAGWGAGSGAGQDALDKYRTQMANMPTTQAIPAPQDTAIAATIAQWKALQQTDALPFDSYASFLTTHPGWPGEAARRRAAERQATMGTAAPASIAAYFRRFPPQTNAGRVAFARALLSVGAVTEANAAARSAWRGGVLLPQDESFLLTSFPGVLTPADQDARMDALLWAGQTNAAARQIALVSPAAQPLFAARLSLRSNAPDAALVAGNTAGLYASDPGYIADRARWLRNSGAAGTARSFLAQPRTLATRPADVDAWYDVLLATARDAAANGEWQSAYDIARQVDDAYPAGTDVSLRPYGERDAYTDLVWLAGQAALKHLGRPADAMTLFDRYGHGSRSPTVRSKGLYWAGSAATQAGRTTEATTYFTAAAGYRDQFYGQLATERLGRPLVPPPALAAVTVPAATRAAFDARDMVRAARFTGQIGDRDDQTAFIKQIAIDATTPTDHILAADLARTLSRPDLGVMVGKSAVANGLSDYSAAGYPTVTVPVGYEANWSLIHAIARQESQFDRAAVSHVGARGLMQLMPGTAREQSGKIGLVYSADALTTDPNLSIMLGSSYFQRIYDRFGSYPLAIAAYNAGGGNVNKWLAANGDPRTGQVAMIDWIEAIPFSETRGYVQRVLENAVVYDLMNPARGLSRGRAAPLSWYLGKPTAG